MIDKVLVTVRAESGKFETDMELPAQLAIAELNSKLLTVLKELAPVDFSDATALTLLCDDKPIPDSSTLESECVWDGSILNVR